MRGMKLKSFLLVALVAWAIPAQARVITNKTATVTDIVTTDTTIEFDLRNAESVSAQIVSDVNTPSAVTFDSGESEVSTATYDTKANSDMGDYLVVYDTAGLAWAVGLTKPVAEVQTLTFPDKATADNGDYIVVENTAGTSFAVALVKGQPNINTITINTLAGSDDGDYVVLSDVNDVTWAVAIDKDGIPAGNPTGAIWAAIPAGRKSNCDVSGEDTAPEMAAAVEACLDAITGFSAVLETDDSEADGTITITTTTDGPADVAVPHNTGDTGAGSIIAGEDQAGVIDQTPTGAAWAAADFKGLADIGADTTEAEVAARAETAFNALTGFTASITTDDTAADGTMTLTSVAKAPVVNPDPHSFDDGGVGNILGVQTTGGVAAVAPTGAIWTAIAAGRKGLADISGDTTAAQVAARAETAFNALTGFSTVITTNDTAADGTMTFTAVIRGDTEDAITKNDDDSGAGSIAVVETNAGVSSEVDVDANTMAIPAHGLTTGLKGQLTTTGTLPTGLSTATDYYVITTSASVIKLAASLADAQAGTAINLTSQGTDGAVNTFTPTALAGGAVKLQKSNDRINWHDEGSATNITADGSVYLEKDRPLAQWGRIHITLTAGRLSATVDVRVKGNDR